MLACLSIALARVRIECFARSEDLGTLGCYGRELFKRVSVCRQ